MAQKEMRRRRGVPAPKIKNPGKLFKRVMGYIGKKYWGALIIAAVLIVISVLANVQGTLFTQKLIDVYIIPLTKTPDPDFGPLAGAIGRVAVYYGIGVLSTYFYNLIMIYVNQGTLLNMREDMFNHMESLPVKYFDTHPHGDIMSMYTNDVDTLRQMISQGLPTIFNSLITIVSVFISMITLSIPLTVLSLFMVFVTVMVSKKLAGLSGSYFVAQQNDLGKVNGEIEEMMNGQKVVKIFNHEEINIDRFNKLNDRLYESAFSANKFANIMMPVNAQIGNLSYVLCAVAGALLAIYGATGLTIGKLVSFLTFNKSFTGPINQLSMQANAIMMALAGADRIFKLLDETPEEDDGYVELVNAKKADNGELTETEEKTGMWAWKHFHREQGTTEYKSLEGEIVLDDVDFGYDPDKQVLYNIRLFAHPGQKIAFVGATGAGKTTITNLINRFYDIQDGKIRYDGININKIRKADLRRSLGMVLQDTHLFNGTVRDNIRYGKLDATEEEIIDAAKLANADAFIRHLPEGYDTVIKGDGGNLSQGQRQLIAIARAAILDPPVLILDEATSSIDTRTEKLVQNGMDRLMHGRTTFVIAHRLSTVRNSDCIMVMDQGHIVERGTHDDLIKEKGYYYRLYTGKTA
ncbi:MAG: ABC transporter ATP-binding protein [Lachnospiraceae bacterium]|nr:ABC transporter ATP-binding protein [Lachnospiraceae bacterium]MEE3460652.1 ABC transporter ATP-binding protein [Lachnospiraceae bacterium]